VNCSVLLSKNRNVYMDKYQIYTERTILISTLIGGPLVAGYLMARNFKAFQEPEKIKYTWIYSILATILTFSSARLLSAIDHSSYQSTNLLIPLIYLAATSLMVKRYQKEKIEKLISSGIKAFTVWRGLGIGCIGLVTTLVIFIFPSFASNMITEPVYQMAKREYGKLNHEIVYTNSKITESEVDSIAQALQFSGFFDEIQQKKILLDKNGDVYEISIGLIENAWNDPIVQLHFQNLENNLNMQFVDKKIIINLCDSNNMAVVKIKLE
jgi:hypothetical protein